MKSYRETIKQFMGKNLKSEIEETANTLGADINEIMFGYFMAGKTFNEKKFIGGTEAKKQIDIRKQKVSQEEFNDQVGRAEIMAKEVIEWARENNYEGQVVKVWWTARPGVLSKAVGMEVDSRKNPTDILLQFTDKQFLGISAKSTKGSGDIGFKNPGIGTISKSLKIDFNEYLEPLIIKNIKKLNLPLKIKDRKQFIRDNPELKEKTVKIGVEILNKLRNLTFKKLVALDQKKRKSHIVSQWLDADDALYPYYIKVTGRGKNSNYSATIMDPVKNDKMKFISSEKIEFVEVGNDSIGVLAGGHKILKMRFKYESEKLASSIKLSGDPW